MEKRVKSLREVVIMGGAIVVPGNITQGMTLADLRQIQGDLKQTPNL